MKTKTPKLRYRVNYRLPPALVKWVKRYAKKKGLSETGVVELALRTVQRIENDGQS